MRCWGTAREAADAAIVVQVVKKLEEGHPRLIDGRVQLIFNTPLGKVASYRLEDAKRRSRRTN